jgi:ADP-heptose:LPS heptosyltransferase
MKTYLVIRFSAMGDVLLTLPVLVAATEQNPEIRFLVLTRPKFSVFFEGHERIKVVSVDVDGQYKSLAGLFRLALFLKKSYQITAVFDLHQHLRSHLLKLFLVGIRSYTLNKGRAEKKALTSEQNKVRKQLPHATERYAAVIRQAGLRVELNQQSKNYFRNLPDLPLKKENYWIGIAPFAQHPGKIWPIDKAKTLLQKVPASCTILLFGGGANEVSILKPIAEKFKNVQLVAGKFSLKEELALISNLDVMLCMDSSNMHMAALAGIKTVSIWGATHTDAGFGPFGMQNHEIVEIPTAELPCRPCSVYGNKPCFRKDYACLEKINPDEVVKMIKY